MRKQIKKALSMVLSAAMVLTLGSGLELKSAKAADTEEWVDTAYTSAVIKYTYTSKGDNSTAPTFFGEAIEGFNGNGTYSAEVASKMQAGWTGNTGYLKNAAEAYTATDVTLTVTTADGTIVFNFGDFESKASADGKEPNNVDFPSVWKVDATIGGVVVTEGNARLVVIGVGDKGDQPALGLQVKAGGEEPEVPGEPEAPAATGSASPAASPATSSAASATPSGATPSPVPATPTPVPEDPGVYKSFISYADLDWAVQYWGEEADETDVVAQNAEVTGPGKYTVSADIK